MSRLDEVEEIKQFGPQLISASKVLSKYCDGINDQFILCKSEHDNPVYCADIGKKVTKCSQIV